MGLHAVKEIIDEDLCQMCNIDETAMSLLYPAEPIILSA